MGFYTWYNESEIMACLLTVAMSRDHSEKFFQTLNFSWNPDFTGLCFI